MLLDTKVQYKDSNSTEYECFITIFNWLQYMKRPGVQSTFTKRNNLEFMIPWQR